MRRRRPSQPPSRALATILFSCLTFLAVSARGFAQQHHHHNTNNHHRRRTIGLHHHRASSSPSLSAALFTAAVALRGGEDVVYDEPEEREAAAVPSSHNNNNIRVETKATTKSSLSIMMMPLAVVSSFAKWYGDSLAVRPIVTKSVTAGLIFALSDVLAQRLETSSSKKNDDDKLNKTRMLTSAAVGLLYFGPAAHYWYDMVFRILPGTSLLATLQKAALGQAFFGPSFTCIFFATSLWQAGEFSLGNWIRKIRQDLPGAWLSGACFWPIVDLVSYQYISKEWIPLFVNMCSLVWTIYLSTIANRGASGNNKAS